MRACLGTRLCYVPALMWHAHFDVSRCWGANHIYPERVINAVSVAATTTLYRHWFITSVSLICLVKESVMDSHKSIGPLNVSGHCCKTIVFASVAGCRGGSNGRAWPRLFFPNEASYYIPRSRLTATELHLQTSILINFLVKFMQIKLSEQKRVLSVHWSIYVVLAWGGIPKHPPGSATALTKSLHLVQIVSADLP